MLTIVLAFILALYHGPNPDRRMPIAEAVAANATTVQEAAILVALAKKENGMEPLARWPFGTTCCRRTMGNWMLAAPVALQIIHRGERECGSLRGAFRRYLSGSCASTPHSDAYATEVMGYYRDLLALPVTLPVAAAGPFHFPVNSP